MIKKISFKHWEMHEAQHQYDFMLNIYEKELTKWAPMRKGREERKNKLFNRKMKDMLCRGKGRD